MPKIVTRVFNAIILDGELLIDDMPKGVLKEEEKPWDKKADNEDDLSGTIHKLAKQVMSYNSEKIRLAWKLHSKSEAVFTILQQTVESSS